MTCSSSHYFPQFLSLENMQQHTKTATCSLQAPCNNSFGQTARATIPTSKLSGQPEQWLDICASVKKNKNNILRHWWQWWANVDTDTHYHRNKCDVMSLNHFWVWFMGHSRRSHRFAVWSESNLYMQVSTCCSVSSLHHKSIRKLLENLLTWLLQAQEHSYYKAAVCVSRTTLYYGIFKGLWVLFLK